MKPSKDVVNPYAVALRAPYGYDTDKASAESALLCLDKSLARQEFKDECDINTIAYRFGLSGAMPQGVRMPSYGDFSGVSDFQGALHVLMGAEEAFMAMPAKVRSRFGNDPHEFMAFCSDRANLEEARSLGLVPAAEAAPGAPGSIPTGAVGPTPTPVVPKAPTAS